MATNVGTLVFLKANDKTFVGQTSLSFKDAATMIETSNKLSGKFSTFEYGRINSNISVGGIASTSKEATLAGYWEMRAFMVANTKVTVFFTEYTSEAAVTNVAAAEKVTATALISSLSWDAPDNEKNTFTCELQLSGAPVISTNTGTIDPPTGDATQVFAEATAATLADIVVVGTAIKWYAAATEGSPLTNSTALETAHTYYASQTISTVESATRLAVAVTIVPTA